MGVGTLIGFLFGSRRAILDLAARRRLLLAGFLLVLSAGIAREYDGGRPWWHVLVPAAVSLVASYGLYVLAFLGLSRAASRSRQAHARCPLFLSGYRVFLGLFWRTAPMAWLYAIPYERFLSPVGAMAANLWTLGCVSAWRVALMTRVLVVLMGYRPLHAVAVVFVFADVLTLAALFFVPVPLIDIMSGARLSPSETLLRDTASAVCIIGSLSLPAWVIGASWAFRRGSPAWQAPTAE